MLWKKKRLNKKLLESKNDSQNKYFKTNVERSCLESLQRVEQKGDEKLLIKYERRLV